MTKPTKTPSTEDRIQSEISRLNRIFSNLSSFNRNNQELAKGLIESAAFLRVTLEDLEKDLITNGYMTSYQQTPKSPIYRRIRPQAKIYNSITRSYLSVISKLRSLLKNCETAAPCTNELEGFLGEG